MGSVRASRAGSSRNTPSTMILAGRPLPPKRSIRGGSEFSSSSPVNAATPQKKGAERARRMWREIRRILAQVTVTFGSTLLANRPIPRPAARPALLLARAQDTTHVLPLDSAGYISREQYRQFLRGLPRITPPAVLRGPGAWRFGGA